MIKEYDKRNMLNNNDDKLKFMSSVPIDELIMLLNIGYKGILIISVCNSMALREIIIKYLKTVISNKLRINNFYIKNENQNVIKLLMKNIQLFDNKKNYKNIISIMNIEIIALNKKNMNDFYQNINMYRDFFTNIETPILFWVNDDVLKNIIIKSPDFWRARVKVIEFKTKYDMIADSADEIIEMQKETWDIEDLKRKELLIKRTLRALNKNDTSDINFYIVSLIYLGQIYDRQFKYLDAEKCYVEALELENKLNNPVTRASIFYQLGMLKQHLNDYEKAKEYYEKALFINKEYNNNVGVAQCYYQLSTIEYEKGNNESSEEYVNMCLNVSEKYEIVEGLAKCYHVLGLINKENNKYDISMKHFKKSLKYSEDINNKSGISATYHNLGILEQKLENFEKSINYFEKSIKLKKDIGRLDLTASSIYHLGVVNYLIGNIEIALSYLNESIDLNKIYKKPSSMAKCYHLIGLIHYSEAEHVPAIYNFLTSAELFNSVQNDENEKTVIDIIKKLLNQVTEEELIKIIKKLPKKIKKYYVKNF